MYVTINFSCYASLPVDLVPLNHLSEPIVVPPLLIEILPDSTSRFQVLYHHMNRYLKGPNPRVHEVTLGLELVKLPCEVVPVMQQHMVACTPAYSPLLRELLSAGPPLEPN